MKMLCFAVVVLLLAAVSCTKSSQPDYFPLVAGAREFMRISTRSIAGADTSETTEVRLVSVVLGQKALPGLGKVWVVETPRDSGPSSYSYFRKTRDAVLQVVPRKGKQALALLYLSLPLKKGKNWYDSDAQRERFAVVAQETVSTEAGVYPNCYKVATIRADADWAMHQWFAPGVGPVKWVSRFAWEKAGVKHEQYRAAELVRLQPAQ